MMLKYAGESVINAIISPSEDTKKAIDAIFSHFWRTLNTPSIEQETTDKEGNTIKIKLTPMEVILQNMASLLWNRIRGSTGAIKAEQNRVESGLMAALGGGIPIPRKGQTTTDFVMEQLASRLMPTIEQKLSNWLDNKSKAILPDQKKKDGWM